MDGLSRKDSLKPSTEEKRHDISHTNKCEKKYNSLKPGRKHRWRACRHFGLPVKDERTAPSLENGVCGGKPVTRFSPGLQSYLLSEKQKLKKPHPSPGKVTILLLLICCAASSRSFHLGAHRDFWRLPSSPCCLDYTGSNKLQKHGLLATALFFAAS